ncbi:bifunctional heptose 7-phosphate kinase/heptose 1-phosphate adenyltransferase [Limnoglobus roseus]|uniref:Carbohydrate kinase n=1 Tax=Limnoglobus roseus TaxID=2598579 RepID=A0A5C1AEA3_9BACT|nr:PfkB family carbohydrate kinase [Limnoglobus roseus]QEL16042.1 carbohydrate kinase [Limnoglobus roseus]
MLTTDLIERILATVPNRTIGLIGDLFLDRYLDIDPARDEPSVETGLTAYQVAGVRSYPGALGTVLNNLVALGVGKLYPIAILGDDGEGYELQQCLAKMPGVRGDGLVLTGDRRTPTYTKPMYGDRELNRLDIKNRTPTPWTLEQRVLEKLDDLFPKFDALLILDQVSEANCGVVTDRVRDRLTALGEEHPTRFLLADSREQIAKFRNVCVKPNRTEFERAGTLRFSRPAFCTDGENGITVVTPTGERTAISAYPVRGPVDICGAGDSCSAGIACAKVAGATHEEAAAFGNLIASITVQQIGTTGTAPPELVRKRWREVEHLGRK